MPLTTSIRLAVDAILTKVADLGTVSDPLSFVKSIKMATGVGAQQADKLFHDRRTISASATDSLDLAGGSLVDQFGAAFTLVKLKAIIVFALAANTNNVLVRRPAANGVPWLTAAGDEVIVKPGGMLVWAAPDLGAIAVTAATGDLLDIVNGAGGTSVDYEIVLIGTSA